jgi:hypothetical protein
VMSRPLIGGKRLSSTRLCDWTELIARSHFFSVAEISPEERCNYSATFPRNNIKLATAV